MISVRNFQIYWWSFVGSAVLLAAFFWPRFISVSELTFSPANLDFFYQVDRVGRFYIAHGCDPKLAWQTTWYAGLRRLPAKLVAAQVVTESHCDPYAVSRDGGVGLLQIEPELWSGAYPGNLQDAETNLRIGTAILAASIQQHGFREGIKRYNGQGIGAEVYVNKVLRLMEER